MRPGPPDESLFDAKEEELQLKMAEAMHLYALDTDATELSGADTEPPDTLGGLLGDMGFTRADIDAAIARDVIAETRETVPLGTHRIRVAFRDLAGGIPERVELDGWLRDSVATAITSELPDGTWDVRITAVRRGE